MIRFYKSRRLCFKMNAEIQFLAQWTSVICCLSRLENTVTLFKFKKGFDKLVDNRSINGF